MTNENEFETVLVASAYVDKSIDAKESEVVEEQAVDEVPEPVIEKPKGKRGGARKGAGRKPVNEESVKKEEAANADPIDQIAAELNPDQETGEEFDESEYETIVIAADTQEKKEYKAYLTGMMLLMVMNLFLPALALKLYSSINPKAKKWDAKDIQLDDKQLAILEECANEVALEIFKKMSPMAQLATGFSIMTAGNILVKSKELE